MKKFVYENATVYITMPNERQVENIKKSTERFVRTLMAKGLIKYEQGRNNQGIGRAGSDARKRDR